MIGPWENFHRWSDELDKNHIVVGKGPLAIVETDPQGTGTVIFDSAYPWVRLQSHNNKHPIVWLNVKKCADAAFLIFKDDAIELHVVELKGNLSAKKWHDACEQFYGMILNVLALLGMMQCNVAPVIICYLAFKEDRVQPQYTDNLLGLKSELGRRNEFGHFQDWETGKIKFPQNLHVVLVKVTRDTSGNATYQL